MQPIEEKDNSPLEDTEITRLIKVSREVGYKKQDKIPERNLVDFKPTSISQIATSFDKKKQNINEAEPLQSSETLENNELENVKKDVDNGPSDSGDNPNLVDVKSSLQENKQEKELEDTLEKSSKSLELSNESAKEIKIDADAANQNQEHPVISPDTSPNEKSLGEEIPNILQETTTENIEEAKQAGIELGKKIAESEVADEQQKVLETFHLVIDNIRKKEIIDKTELSQSILEVVTRLASERAGKAIEENSEPFKNKIISFVERIEKASKKLILKLNPKDASIIEKSLQGFFNHEEFEIKESSELFRGDFILQMGSVEIGDLISEQISINVENEAKTSEKKEMQIDADEQDNTEIISEYASPTNENGDIHKSSGDEIEK